MQKDKIRKAAKILFDSRLKITKLETFDKRSISSVNCFLVTTTFGFTMMFPLSVFMVATGGIEPPA